MLPPDGVLEIVEIRWRIQQYIYEHTVQDLKTPGMLLCKKCKVMIREGFFNLLLTDSEGNLWPEHRKGIMYPLRVPYCENCDPPDRDDFVYTKMVEVVV
jgi:hypothetical protein